MTVLIEADDRHFAWMLGETAAPRGLALAPGGVDDPATIAMLRGMAAKLRTQYGGGHWLMVDDGEVVGLCGFKQVPKDGIAEIGYGVAASRRRRGHATRAVAAILNEVSNRDSVRRFTAETAIDNTASQRVLEHNGFTKSGTRNDPDDGELIVWHRSAR
jgi:RimJ/RimL family protein N-acetyltransferase